MLTIVIPGNAELYNEITNEFIPASNDITLKLEHSLVSLSKWESKWCKPFLTNKEKSTEETLDYIKCMTLTQNVDDETYSRLTEQNIAQIRDYIQAPMTATTFRKEENSKNNREQITSELIYYWMLSLNIPVEFQKWHLNRLLTLIRVCNVKNQPANKRSQSAIANDYAALNAARRKQLNTKG